VAPNGRFEEANEALALGLISGYGPHSPAPLAARFTSMPLRHRIKRLLTRESPSRQSRAIPDPPVVIFTETGNRSENQDRVAMVRLASKLAPLSPAVAVAVSDGMGGMQDGAECASLALASFFEALVRLRSLHLTERLEKAAEVANQQVYAFAGGRGGATLSAVVVEGSLPPHVVNVGDSRVYAAPEGAAGERRDLLRLTVDDSMVEAFGSQGRDLVQFIGIGAGMKPHVTAAPTPIDFMLLTTDGVHYLDPKLFSTIAIGADSARQAVERLAALARWCGAPDNATIAGFDPRELSTKAQEFEDGWLEVWTPSETVEIFWSESEPERPYPNEPTKSDRREATSSPARQTRRGRSRKSRKSEATAKKESPTDQLKIEIDVGEGDSPDANRGKI
jgi:PPM family protein phosphatase